MRVALLQAKTCSNGRNQEKSINNLIDVLEQRVSVLVGPEWYFLKPKPNQLYTEQEKDNLLGRIAEQTKQYDTLVIPGTIAWEKDKQYRNTAYAFYKGEQMLEYHKRRNGGDCGIAENNNTVFVKGTEGGLFTWKDLQLGMEICRDHNERELREHCYANKIDRVDIHIISGSHSDVKRCSTYAKKYGYILSSDGYAGAEAFRCIRQGMKGLSDQLEPVKSVKYTEGYVIYNVTLI